VFQLRGWSDISTIHELSLTAGRRSAKFDTTRNVGATMDSDHAVQALGALAHDTRLALYRMLVECGPDGLSAGVIAERLGVAPSSLTFHVQHLHRAGLVTQRRLGRQLIYAADYAAMNGLVGYLTENCCGGGAAEQSCMPTRDRRSA
jgi:ArsR family transcriptional regulator, arsenate/arsenite/antimonite-responsive transcriptional repressor